MVTAVDWAEAESALPNSVYLNASLLSARNLRVEKMSDNLSEIHGKTPNCNVAGYLVYLGQEDNLVKLTPSPITEIHLTDMGYPAEGVWQTRYNKAGQSVEEGEANGKTSAYIWDVLTGWNDTDHGWNESSHASFTYDGVAVTTPEATVDKPTITSNLRFPGQYENEEIGLYYNWNRYYSPDEGRYITADPIGLEEERKLYAYAGGVSLNLTDPTGEIPFGTPIAVGAITGWIFNEGIDYVAEERKPGSYGKHRFTTSLFNIWLHNLWERTGGRGKYIPYIKARHIGSGLARSFPYVGTAVTLYRIRIAFKCD
jgi:RHS repeat-associated protein